MERHPGVGALLIATLVTGLPPSVVYREPRLMIESGAKPTSGHIVVGYLFRNHARLVVALGSIDPPFGLCSLRFPSGSTVQVNRTGDLSGHAVVHSSGDALALARTFTAPDTCLSGLLISTARGDLRAIEVMPRDGVPTRQFGVLSSEHSIRLKPVVHVARRRSGWTVERLLAVLDTNKPLAKPLKIYRSSERVGPSGSYRLVRLTLVADVLQAGLSLPTRRH